MKVYAVKCLKCKDIIYSRCRHDYRKCTCGIIAIDGGFEEYRRIIGNPKHYEQVWIEVDQTQDQLKYDWHILKDKYGLIKGKK